MMIKPEQIPDEAVDAMLESIGSFFCRAQARAACAAMLAAWPGIEIHTDGTEDWIELTLTQENNDD
jgi:hypothetical protein